MHTSRKWDNTSESNIHITDIKNDDVDTLFIHDNTDDILKFQNMTSIDFNNIVLNNVNPPILQGEVDLNSNKIGITQDQSDSIIANNLVRIVTIPDLSLQSYHAYIGNTAYAIDQQNQTIINNAKIGISQDQSDSIIANDLVRIVTIPDLSVQSYNAFIGNTPYAIDQENKVTANTSTLSTLSSSDLSDNSNIGKLDENQIYTGYVQMLGPSVHIKTLVSKGDFYQYSLIDTALARIDISDVNDRIKIIDTDLLLYKNDTEILSCDLTNPTPKLSLNNNTDIFQDNIGTGLFAQVGINTTAISNTNNTIASNGGIVNVNEENQNINGQKYFLSSVVSIDGGTGNSGILHKDGRLNLTNTTENTNIQMTTGSHISLIVSDEANQNLSIDQNVNIPLGKQFQINNIQIDSTNLNDHSQLMRTPTIWTLDTSNTITIGTETNASTLLFHRTDLFVNGDTNVSEELPNDEAFYTMRLSMNGNSSSSNGLYHFNGTSPFILANNTGDNDGTPEIELPLTVFFHASKHGKMKLIFTPANNNNWTVHLVFDEIDPTLTNDQFSCKIQLKKEYWG
jgi:hypothetical protein